MRDVLDAEKLMAFVRGFWGSEILPDLENYITVPAVSPTFDDQWAAHGHIHTAARLAYDWCLPRVPGSARLSIEQIPGRTPLLFIEIPGTDESGRTALVYGHLDKQPPMKGWSDGLGPWKPVLRDGKLYGRGGADDGYAVFAAVCALRALHDQGKPYPRIVMMIECSEESSSPDLPAYVELLKERIGDPSLVVCLDSGAGDYERLWLTTSLRGVISGRLRVQVLKRGVHSGAASGIVPDPFWIICQLYNRLVDVNTGRVAQFLQPVTYGVDMDEVRETARLLGNGIWQEFPWEGSAIPAHHEGLDALLLQRTHLPTVTITGADGFPVAKIAGNVLLAGVELKVSVRLPPGMDAEAAMRALTRVLTDNPPCSATVTFTPDTPANGWLSPPLAPWLEEALAGTADLFDGREPARLGEGGTIPFMSMLGRAYRKAQFMVVGVLGPHSNAHGPDESLHLDYAHRLTGAVARVLHAHAMHM